MSLGQQLAPHLPFLRRYARALTGSQQQGDKYVRATLEAIVAAPEEFPTDVDPRLGLYRMYQAIWASANIDGADETSASDIEGGEAIARARLAQMAPLSRQALLLTAMEGFTPEDAAYLAALPKAPSTYHPVRAKERAITRRNYVLREMFDNRYITEEEYKAARIAPLRTVQNGISRAAKT